MCMVIIFVTFWFVIPGSDKFIHNRDMAWLMKSDGQLTVNPFSLLYAEIPNLFAGKWGVIVSTKGVSF